jgi:hypothetical protein
MELPPPASPAASDYSIEEESEVEGELESSGGNGGSKGSGRPYTLPPPTPPLMAPAPQTVTFEVATKAPPPSAMPQPPASVPNKNKNNDKLELLKTALDATDLLRNYFQQEEEKKKIGDSNDGFPSSLRIADTDSDGSNSNNNRETIPFNSAGGLASSIQPQQQQQQQPSSVVMESCCEPSPPGLVAAIVAAMSPAQPLIDYLAAWRKCSVRELELLLLHSADERRRIAEHCREQLTLHTTHLKNGSNNGDNNRFAAATTGTDGDGGGGGGGMNGVLVDHNVTVRCDEISAQPSSRCMAMGGYLNISVQQYFYVRHKKRLLRPFMPCVVEVCAGGRHRSYYPMEVLSCTGRLGQ